MTTHTWIYSLARPLEPQTREALNADFEAFLNQWKTHGAPVRAKIELRFDRFVIVQADPQDNRPSGCSIDSMRRAVERILAKNGVPTLDAGHVFFRKNGEIESLHFRDIATAVEAGSLRADTIIFDHTLGQTDDLSNWEVPLSASWMARYVPTETKN